MKFVFLRDDDVFKLDWKLEKFCQLILSLKMPVIFGVIPKKITPTTVNFLNQLKQKHFDLIDIVQHGYQHKNYSLDPNCKYEFGLKRTYLQQKSDILAGKKLMEKYFGRNFTPAFIPPFHGYNLDTLKVINELSYKVFSAGKKTSFPNKFFLDLPARMSLSVYLKNHTKTLNLKEMIIKFTRACFGSKVLGIVLHHQDLDDFESVGKFFRFIQMKSKKSEIKLINFSAILKLKK